MREKRQRQAATAQRASHSAWDYLDPPQEEVVEAAVDEVEEPVDTLFGFSEEQIGLHAQTAPQEECETPVPVDLWGDGGADATEAVSFNTSWLEFDSLTSCRFLC